MFYIRNFRELIPYKKALNIHQNIINANLSEKEKHEITVIVLKVCRYIAGAEGSALYLQDRRKYLIKAIKWTNILDKKIRELKLSEQKIKEYKSEIIQIRKILISLKNNLEVNKQ